MNHDYDIAYTNAAAPKEPEGRKSPSSAPMEDGAFTALPTEMQDSLVETSRKKLAHDEPKEAERTLAQHLYFSELEKAKKDKKLASLRHQFKNTCIAFEIERLGRRSARSRRRSRSPSRSRSSSSSCATKCGTICTGSA